MLRLSRLLFLYPLNAMFWCLLVRDFEENALLYSQLIHPPLLALPGIFNLHPRVDRVG
jgi:hypothetical protein